MFTWLEKRFSPNPTARDIYGAIVARAREPRFYTQLGAQDTPEGRYELIALHLVLVLEKIGQSTPTDEELRRHTVEAFVTDIDDAMREMGVGDTNVPKNVKRATAGLYTRAQAYREALAESDNAKLEAALVTYVYRGTDHKEKSALAKVIRTSADDLAQQPAAQVREGRMTFHPQFGA